MWRREDPQGAEVGKVKFDIVPYVRGRLIDVGCGPFKIFPYAIGVDNYGHAHQFGWEYKPDVFADASDLSMFGSGAVDSVFSSHTLEHVVDPEKTLREWFRVIKKDGYLVLYLPHKDLYPNIGEDGANPDHKNDFLPESIIKLMKKVGHWDLVVNEVRDADFGPGSTMNEYSFLQVYQKKSSGHRILEQKKEKTAVVIRYGGIGDMIQTSSVLPLLKKEGYKVLFNTTPSGKKVLENDPNIDGFLLQDTDQVPNNELGPYWAAMERKYDRVINFSESVENTLLAIPGSTLHRWPKEARHAVTNVNYLEHMHTIAELDQEYNPKFYPTQKEREWATSERAKMGGDFIICVSMSGSSVHKTWPYFDNLFARLLTTYRNCRIVLTGNEAGKILEKGWEHEDQVIKRSGVWDIRQALSFVVTQADLVIGPETGVVNAVGMEDVGKVVFLSHSTQENLTKHWVNTVPLIPETSCYPCHQLHYSFEFCRRDEKTGVSQCQSDITLDMAWDAVLSLVKTQRKVG